MGERATGRTTGFTEAWQDLDPAFRRSLELAHESLAGGGPPVSFWLWHTFDTDNEARRPL